MSKKNLLLFRSLGLATGDVIYFDPFKFDWEIFIALAKLVSMPQN